MARLVDADALIEVLKAQDYSNAPNTLEEWTPQDMTDAEIFDINNAPTVDAVEVVRCKDCLYRDGNACDYSAVYVRPNGYCQWGRRREDEAD